MVKLSLLVTLPFVAQAKTFFRPAAVQPKAKAVTSIPRGGAGPLDADFAAKLFITAYGANAVACAVGGKPVLKTYGMAETDSNNAMMKTVSLIGLAQSILLYLQKFKDMPFTEALRWSAASVAAMRGYLTIIGSDDAINASRKKSVLPVVINAVLFYAASTDASWAKGYYTFYGLWSLMNGIMCYFTPEEAAKLWDVSLSGTKAKLGALAQPQLMFFVSTFGYFLLGHAASVLLQVNDTCDVNGAIGWSAVAIGGALLRLVATGAFAKAGNSQVFLPAAWVSLLAVIAASLF